jgi:hypothetical protein
MRPAHLDRREHLERARRHLAHVREQTPEELRQAGTAVAQSRDRIEASLELLRRLRVHRAPTGDQVARL